MRLDFQLMIGELKKEIVKSLHNLHSLNITHGDPRIPNIVFDSDGNLKWIDVRETGDIKNDVVIIWSSFYCKDFDVKYNELLDLYCNDLMLTTLQDIMFTK